MIIYFYQFLGRNNSTSSRILFSGNTWLLPNGGNLLIYSTIFSTLQIKSCILVLRGLYSPLWGYLFWRLRSFGGKKFLIHSFMTNSQFVLVLVPLSQVVCSKNHRTYPTTRFRVILNFWGPKDRSWPRIILVIIVTNLKMASRLPDFQFETAARRFLPYHYHFSQVAP